MAGDAWNNRAMHLLDRADYARVTRLVPSRGDAGHMALVHAVIEGSMPGHIAVDDVEAPRSALACQSGGFFFAIGEANGPLVARFMPELLRRCLGPEPTGLWATTPEWAEALDPLFATHRFRNEYHPGPRLGLDRRPPPEGFRLAAIDPQIAAKFGDGTDAWVVRTWGGPQAFGDRVFGYALMKGDELASFCTACAIAGPPGEVEAEIEIGTDGRYRQRGLAYAVACAFFDECARRELHPAWTCDSANEASARLADSLGFVEFRKVTGYPLDSRMTLRDGRWTPSAG